MCNEKTLEKIKSMIVYKCGINKDKILIDSKIEDDLGLTGDDAVEFILTFSKEFNVDISNFVISDYFSREGFDFISPIVNFFSKKETVQKKNLTVGDLIKITEIGRLDEETINMLDNKQWYILRQSLT